MNREWHAKSKMPQDATMEQRVGVEQRQFRERRPTMHLERRFYLVLALVSLLVIAGAAVMLASPMTSAGGDEIACSPPGGKAEQIADAKLIFEYNSNDIDTGVHGLFDTRGWSELCVYDPGGRLILAVKPQGQLQDLTMGGIFFESREPPDEEMSQEEILANFPEGKYRVEGTTYLGTRLTGAATLTHDIPAPPTIATPAEGDVVDPDNLVVRWEPVTRTVEGKPVDITGYEVIVTKERHEDPHGFSKPDLSAHVLPSATSLTIPSEFLEPGTEYELEVLALEQSGNQTITVLFFETE
jgi:hypothetical protein